MRIDQAEYHDVHPDVRSRPTAKFISEIRRLFPVEPEIDRVLTRKMERRSGPGYHEVSLEALAESTAALIRARTHDNCVIRNARWLQGGASKLQMAFDLDWTDADRLHRKDIPMVLRMESPEGIVETSRRREFEIIELMQGIVAVPSCYWMDADGEFLPHPGLVYGFVKGVAKPKASQTKVTGVGTSFEPKLREALGRQFASDLGKIHTVPAAKIRNLTTFQQAEVGSNASIIRQVNWWRRVWEEDRPEDNPLVNTAARWLIANAPPLDHVSVVHGDFRAGNFLFDEEDRRVTAWLDWELSVLGDRHQDIAWATAPHFGHLAEDGHTFLVSGLISIDDFYRDYQASSDLTIDLDRLRFYRIYNDFMTTVHMLATAWRVSKGGKTHQDVTVAWLSMIGHVVLAQLRNSLEEVL